VMVAVFEAEVALVTALAVLTRGLRVRRRRADVIAHAAVVRVVLEVTAIGWAGAVSERFRAATLLLDARRVDWMTDLTGLAGFAAHAAARAAAPPERVAAGAGGGRELHVPVAVEPQPAWLCNAHPRAIREPAVGVRPIASVRNVERIEGRIARARAATLST